MRLSSLLFISLLLRLSNSQEPWDCGPPCKCKWVSGKKTADCTQQNFTHIPSYLLPDTQNLDLTQNHISHVQEGAFTRVGLVNLHKLVMRHCGIHTIHSGAFNGLKIVIEVDLSGNHITNLMPGTFLETQKLRVLLLNHNSLKSLDDGLFHDLEHLQRVEISQNRLERIAENTFKNLPGLLTLALNDNNITSVKLATFENLPKLGSLELRNNPWHCNCHLKKFRNWTLERKLYTKGTTCFLPEALAGKGWDEVDSDEFACRPKILSIGAYPQIGVGDTVTMWCHALGIPRPQLSWVHRSRVLNNSTKRQTSDRGYYLLEGHDWLNLTITDVIPYDKGEYICIAKSPGGSVERNLTLAIAGDVDSGKTSLISLPLALGLGVTLLIFLLFFLTVCTWYWRRKKRHEGEKSADVTSLEHHGLGEQEKSLITAINPVVKPPRRYEAPSVTSHGTEMTELNRTLLDNDSVFADGVGSIIGVMGGMLDDRSRATPEPHIDSSTLLRGASYRHYPPDLLAFSGGRGASPTSQSSTLPDTRSSTHYQHQSHPQQSPSQQQSPRGFSPSSGQYPAAFKTLPHNLNRQMGVYSPVHPVMPRHGYVTIPRRPRAPSWSSGPPSSPVDHLEPVYDNLGARTTADGSSVLSLNKINKSPEPVSSMRMRPLPSTPTSSSAKPQASTPTPAPALSPLSPPRSTPTPPGSTPTSLPQTSARFHSIQRSTPNIFNSSGHPLDRSAPEGAPEWFAKLPDEMEKRGRRESSSPLTISPGQTPTTPSSSSPNTSSTLGRKIPPRPPPKPKKKSNNGPLYEDEGEDGTEV
ncbi:GSCOCG00006065001-RA-CDS [Cotesia congregata]